MQTFLPYPDFELSMQALDYRRLGKQRVEALQLYRALTGYSNTGWLRHPATKMWLGHEVALGEYMDLAILEWLRRGYRNTMKLTQLRGGTRPPWLGDANFHAAHRSNLLRKAPEFYSKFNWVEPTNLAYIWPTTSGLA